MGLRWLRGAFICCPISHWLREPTWAQTPLHSKFPNTGVSTRCSRSSIWVVRDTQGRKQECRELADEAVTGVRGGMKGFKVEASDPLIYNTDAVMTVPGLDVWVLWGALEFCYSPELTNTVQTSPLWPLWLSSSLYPRKACGRQLNKTQMWVGWVSKGSGGTNTEVSQVLYPSFLSLLSHSIRFEWSKWWQAAYLKNSLRPYSWEKRAERRFPGLVM